MSIARRYDANDRCNGAGLQRGLDRAHGDEVLTAQGTPEGLEELGRVGADAGQGVLAGSPSLIAAGWRCTIEAHGDPLTIRPLARLQIGS
jgi:hypothetical protein